MRTTLSFSVEIGGNKEGVDASVEIDERSDGWNALTPQTDPQNPNYIPPKFLLLFRENARVVAASATLGTVALVQSGIAIPMQEIVTVSSLETASLSKTPAGAVTFVPLCNAVGSISNAGRVVTLRPLKASTAKTEEESMKEAIAGIYHAIYTATADVYKVTLPPLSSFTAISNQRVNAFVKANLFDTEKVIDITSQALSVLVSFYLVP